MKGATGGASQPLQFEGYTMDAIADYSNEHHRRCVMELWETVFGYETAHNTPSLAIDKKLAAADGLFFVALSGQ